MIVAAGMVAAVSAQRGVVLPPRGTGPAPVPQTLPVFRSRVDLIHLDVAVLDDQRRPVRGLGPSDFTVLENGKPQDLSVFNAVDIPDPAPPKTAWLRTVAPDVRSNAEDHRERRLFLILIDDAAVQGVPFAMQNLKKVATDFIEKLGPSDLAAVVFTLNNKNSQDFTPDRGRLLSAVDKYTGGFRDMGGDNSLYFRYSVDVLRRSVEMLTKLQDRRKALVYVGQGVPVDLAMAAGPAALGLSGSGGFSAISQRGEMGQLRYLMEQTFLAATRGNVRVYTLDVCGLRVDGQRAGFGPVCVPGIEIDYLQNVATVTGGHAVINTNEFGPGIDAIFRENSSYYLLGYQSADPRSDGKFRRIEVEVNRPGVTVKTRQGYMAETENAAKRKAELAAEPIGAALAGVLPKGDLPMLLTAVPFAIPGKKESAVAVMLSVRQPVRDPSVRHVERVDMLVNAYNTDGKFQGGTRLRADVTVRAGATGLAEYEVLGRLDLKPGRYQLRMAANVGALSTSGSLYYDLDVPDFSQARVSLSGLVFTARPAMPIGQQDGMKNVIPLVPTTQRAFGGQDQVAAFVRVYQGGKDALVDVPLRIELRNQDDVVVLDRLESITGQKFAATGTARSADVNLTLPVSKLAPGEYLLTIEAFIPGPRATNARRAVRFKIQ